MTIGFKAVSGKVDQAGGVVVRLQDPQNYYIARANALENNVRFYRVVAGKREQLASADRKVSRGAYHKLTLRAEGDRFTVLFNGAQLFTATDSTFRTAGKAGFWTKADSITRFDALDMKPLQRSTEDFSNVMPAWWPHSVRAGRRVAAGGDAHVEGRLSCNGCQS